LAIEALVKGETLDLPAELPSLELAATLPARALRHLFAHSEMHLNVCWRDLTKVQWDLELILPDGTNTTPRALPLIRAKNIWQNAMDLGNGGRLADLPLGVM
jgi:maleylpyruvate isomerase